MTSKKAQVSGAPAASVILVIGAFILIYILLLPPGEREKLLEGDDDTLSEEEKESLGILLEERPGTVTKLREREFDHNIPSFNLLVEQEDATLKKVDSVFIESSGVTSRTIPLFVENTAENGRLTFSVNDHKGLLTVQFNGDEILKGDITTLAEPLSLENIQRENLLEFSVDSPSSWRFWEKNMYDIRNVHVTATVENLERREAVNTFFVSREEADRENIDQAYIIYLVDCSVTEAGILNVFLNDNLLSSKIPDCGSLEKTFIDPDDLVEGKNEIRFVADQGRYLIDQIFVKTKLRKPITPIYFFDINETQFENIDNGTINATLQLRFVDDDERKTAVIAVNDHRIFLDTRQDSFTKNIDPFIEEGSNSIRIEPEKTLHILELKVKLDCQKKRDCD